MKGFGILLLVIAAVAFLVGFSRDTSVASGLGGRVHNIGLMHEKQNIIIFAGVLAVVGAVFFGFGGRTVQTAEGTNASTRACPFCAEIIKTEAKICRFCQKELPSTSQTTAQSKPIWTPQLEALSNAIFHNDVSRVKQLISQGVDPNTPNENGITPVQMACNCERKEIVKLLTNLPNERSATTA